MLEVLRQESELQSTEGNIDLIIHSAAVGNYKADYTFLLEDMAKEIAYSITLDDYTTPENLSSEILSILKKSKMQN